MKSSNFIEVTASVENFEKMRSFTEEKLKKNNINREISDETLLVFEALFHNMLNRGFEDTPLTIRVRKSFGEININIEFKGEPFVAFGSEPGSSAPEDSILTAFEDKFDCNYWNGCNHIRIVVKRSFKSSLFLGFIAVFSAILVYIPINAFVSLNAQLTLADKIVFPLVKMFSNAMLMVGAPVTFFSLLKNFTDIYIISESNRVGRRLQVKTLITSVIAVILAIGSSFIIAFVMSDQLSELSDGTWIGGKTPSFSEMIESSVPSGIFAPFETIMPVPLIIVALIVAYAFCTSANTSIN
ncbi:MAG: cation:dicarboxylase symporter family transporter [Clostridia bacterium]|nr:cation:dicarboxylase symporter family transporter [Clostridia bacterium]